MAQIQSRMASVKKVSDESFLELMKKVQIEEEKQRFKSHVQVGKELVLACLWLKQMVGTQNMFIQNDIPTCLAQFLAFDPEALKVILGYYEQIKEVDVINCLHGLRANIVNGELMIHLNWKPVDASRKSVNIKPAGE